MISASRLRKLEVEVNTDVFKDSAEVVRVPCLLALLCYSVCKDFLFLLDTT